MNTSAPTPTASASAAPTATVTRDRMAAERTSSAGGIVRGGERGEEREADR